MRTAPLPFIVTTDAGVYCGEYETRETAEASAKDRNERAETLGVSARYEVRERVAA